jgi:hypothetical protein
VQVIDDDRAWDRAKGRREQIAELLRSRLHSLSDRWLEEDARQAHVWLYLLRHYLNILQCDTSD